MKHQDMPWNPNSGPYPHAFEDASQTERRAYIDRTNRLRAGRVSDIERWSEPSAYKVGWADRTPRLAAMIRPNESVFEFGAGTAEVERLLPPGTLYAAGDLAPLRPSVTFYDLNAQNLEPIAGFKVALFSGVLEYVHDLERLSQFLADTFQAVVCSYAVAADTSSGAIEQRRYNGWFTDYDEAGFIALFTSAGFALVERDAWQSQCLFRFEQAHPVRATTPATR